MNEEKSIIQVSDVNLQKNKPENKLDKMGNKASQVAKKASAAAIKAGKAIVNAPLPPSINWLYGFGFKIGILIVLKSFLVMRYQWANLSREGFWMVSSQLILSLILISCGLIMQTQRILENPRKLVTGFLQNVISRYN